MNQFLREMDDFIRTTYNKFPFSSEAVLEDWIKFDVLSTQSSFIQQNILLCKLNIPV